MSSCFSRCLRVPIAIRAFYESYLWILQTLLLTHPDLHPALLADFLWNGTDHVGFTSYQSATGLDSHSQYADPLFLNLATPDLHIEATSPAVNRGINLGSVVGTLDFAGNPRTQAGNIDIGAYQQ